MIKCYNCLTENRPKPDLGFVSSMQLFTPLKNLSKRLRLFFISCVKRLILWDMKGLARPLVFWGLTYLSILLIKRTAQQPVLTFSITHLMKFTEHIFSMGQKKLLNLRLFHIYSYCTAHTVKRKILALKAVYCKTFCFPKLHKVK